MFSFVKNLRLLFFCITVVFLVPVVVFSASDTTNVNLTVGQENVPPDDEDSTIFGPIDRSFENPSLEYFSVISGTRGALIEWKTSRSLRGRVTVGVTPEREGRVLTELSPVANHHTLIDNLTPGTRYYFSLQGAGENGNFYELTHSSFVTAPLFTEFSPENVRDFQAQAREEGVLLTWKNPLGENIQYIRIVRSSEYYPATPFEGELVFEGKRESFLDSNTEENTTYYYSAFVRDDRGRYSSGALADIFFEGRPGGDGGEENNDLSEGGEVSSSTSATSSKEEFTRLSLSDFSFSQGGNNLPVDNGVITVRKNKNILVSLKGEYVSTSTETVVVDIDLGRRAPGMYFLRTSQEKQNNLSRSRSLKGTLQAVIPAFEDKDVYSFSVFFFNKDRELQQKLNGRFNVEDEGLGEPSSQSIFSPLRFFGLSSFFLLLIFIAVLLLLLALLIDLLSRDKKRRV